MKKINLLGYSFLILGLNSICFAESKSAIPVAPAVASAAQPSISTDPWKGEIPSNQYTGGFMGGLGLIDPKIGFIWSFNIARKIVDKGFVPDIANCAFVELQAGPDFVAGHTAFVYSAHVRWDFIYDLDWTYYALGGLGGNITGAELGDRAMLFPRIALGAMRRLDHRMHLRGEISHEMMTIGLGFNF